jgi:hypothetical protein
MNPIGFVAGEVSDSRAILRVGPIVRLCRGQLSPYGFTHEGDSVPMTPQTSVVAILAAHNPRATLIAPTPVLTRSQMLDAIAAAYEQQTGCFFTPINGIDQMSPVQVRQMPITGSSLEIAKGVLMEHGVRVGLTFGDFIDIADITKARLAVIIGGATQTTIRLKRWPLVSVRRRPAERRHATQRVVSAKNKVVSPPPDNPGGFYLPLTEGT